MSAGGPLLAHCILAAERAGEPRQYITEFDVKTVLIYYAPRYFPSAPLAD